MELLRAINAETIALLALFAVALVSLVRFAFPRSPGRQWQREDKYQRRSAEPFRGTFPRPHDPTDPSDQLRVVMAASFSPKRIMRQGEYRVFRIVESLLRSSPEGRRVFAQTALGEIIESPDRQAHSAINSKRVDALIIGPTGLPLVAIEYQGPGHYQHRAAARDAVKKEALRRAGVQYVEIMDFHSDDDIARLTREALIRASAPEAQAKS